VSPNGLTKYEGDVPPVPLAGWSAWTLMLRGTVAELLGAAMIIPLVFAAVNHQDAWMYLFLGIGLVVPGVGVLVSLSGEHKVSREVAAGYVTVPQRGLRNPYVFLLNRKDFHVLLYPGQARPRSMLKKDMDAWRLQFDYPENAGQ
jgi:hypothetical protein